MKTFISMLRGINVGGQKKITMSELKSVYESLNLENVTTYVQSGNVVFDSSEQDLSKLEQLLETQIEYSFGYSVSVFLRDISDFKHIIDTNPFLHGRNEDPAKLHVTFLYQLPAGSDLNSLETAKGGVDEFLVGGKEIFLFCPNGYGKTKLSNTFFERKLQIPATTRNWKTVNALYTMASAK